jgi:hypothetical protein
MLELLSSIDRVERLLLCFWKTSLMSEEISYLTTSSRRSEMLRFVFFDLDAQSPRKFTHTAVFSAHIVSRWGYCAF